jgi:acyl carrier protein
MTNHIEETVTTIISEHLGVDAARVQLTTKIKDDLGADSLDAIELLMATEEAFKIEISDDEGEKVTTVSDIVALVKTKTNQ